MREIEHEKIHAPFPQRRGCSSDSFRGVMRRWRKKSRWMRSFRSLSPGFYFADRRRSASPSVNACMAFFLFPAKFFRNLKLQSVFIRLWSGSESNLDLYHVSERRARNEDPHQGYRLDHRRIGGRGRQRSFPAAQKNGSIISVAGFSARFPLHFY